MSLRTHDLQAARCPGLLVQLDVRTAARHVGGDGHLAGASGLRYDLCFELVLFGVQHVVLDAAEFEHAAQQLRNLHRRGTHQHGASLAHEAHDLLDHGVVLLALGLVDEVLAVVADDRTVRGDHHHVQLVDAPELRSLGLGRTGHARELVVHAEVVLKRDGGECLSGGFHFHAFLGFDCLMQTVGVATTLHDTTCLFVDNLDFVVVNHIFHVLFKKGVGFEQLGHSVYAFCLDGVVLHQFVLALTAFCQILYGFGFR